MGPITGSDLHKVYISCIYPHNGDISCIYQHKGYISCIYQHKDYISCTVYTSIKVTFLVYTSIKVTFLVYTSIKVYKGLLKSYHTSALALWPFCFVIKHIKYASGTWYIRIFYISSSSSNHYMYKSQLNKNSFNLFTVTICKLLAMWSLDRRR